MFTINDNDPKDPYSRLFSEDVVGAINNLTLPRYGLGNYQKPSPHKPPTPEEARVLADLSRAGTRLMGFCRTNLFKRLESSGHAFLLSVERHILRNFIFLHAIENGLPLSFGTQDIGLLDTWANDQDSELWEPANETDNNGETDEPLGILTNALTEKDFHERAAAVYNIYTSDFKRRFKWLMPELFDDTLEKDLKEDAVSLLTVLARAGAWSVERDAKLQALLSLLTQRHPKDKVLIFSQFADTVNYLETQLKAQHLSSLAGITGNTDDPTAMAYRFSPVSNGMRNQVKPEDELCVVVATDVLSEGKNLQDCAVIVNYDLPWAIIRLIQRAGRVDRIGQQVDTILCYSFLPADGVERIIRLRARVRQRLQKNADVVGADETFFEDQDEDQTVRDLFTEKADILDGDTDYLKNRMAMVQQASGKDRFQTFYRYFLLRLFHDGLGKSPSDRKLDLAMENLLGRVPFLNGGFFEVHQLEVQNPDIDIPDHAFENLFAFFDQYCWHLDDRPLRLVL